jgi:hypothetical protein
MKTCQSSICFISLLSLLFFPSVGSAASAKRRARQQKPGLELLESRFAMSSGMSLSGLINQETSLQNRATTCGAQLASVNAAITQGTTSLNEVISQETTASASQFPTLRQQVRVDEKHLRSLGLQANHWTTEIKQTNHNLVKIGAEIAAREPASPPTPTPASPVAEVLSQKFAAYFNQSIGSLQALSSSALLPSVTSLWQTIKAQDRISQVSYVNFGSITWSDTKNGISVTIPGYLFDGATVCRFTYNVQASFRATAESAMTLMGASFSLQPTSSLVPITAWYLSETLAADIAPYYPNVTALDFYSATTAFVSQLPTGFSSTYLLTLNSLEYFNANGGIWDVLFTLDNGTSNLEVELSTTSGSYGYSFGAPISDSAYGGALFNPPLVD